MNIPDQQWFESRSEDPFEIKFADKAVPCRIAEINQSQAPSTREGEKQFSVIFAKPEAEVFGQGLYQVSHPDLQNLSLFLVPVYGDDQVVHYEAIFT